MNAPLAQVREVLGETLGIGDKAAGFDADTPLLDHLPELDSMGVVEVIVALEGRFGIEIDDADVSGEVFETLGTLTDFVGSKLEDAQPN